MKRFFALMLAVGMLFALVSCGKQVVSTPTGGSGTVPELRQDEVITEPRENMEDVPQDEMTSAPDETTSAADDASDGIVSVNIIAAGGAPVAPYRDMVYTRKGSFVADGRLMFFPVSEVLPDFADEVPAVTLDENSKVEITAVDKKASGGKTLHVYGEDFSLLMETQSMAEILAHGNTDWAGKTVYLYFTVTEQSRTTESCYAYFVKVTFDA